MAIPEHARKNFQTLLSAQNGDLALMECKDATTGTTRYVVCAVAQNSDDYVFTPFGHLEDGNPYEDYLPSEREEVREKVSRKEREKVLSGLTFPTSSRR